MVTVLFDLFYHNLIFGIKLGINPGWKVGGAKGTRVAAFDQGGEVKSVILSIPPHPPHPGRDIHPTYTLPSPGPLERC